MKYITSALAILLVNFGAFALPQGGRVETGKGNLENPAHIIQESQHLQTRWDSFDIGTTEQVRIEQPNAQASINIKVSNGGATNINGTLTANGRVSLENPAGIQFGANSVVNVGGLLASSANGAVTSLGQVSAAEAIRFQGLSNKSIVNVGGDVSAQEIIVEGNGDIVIGNSANLTASKQVLIGGGYQGKDSNVLNSQKTDVKTAAQINAPYVIVWSDKETRFLGRIDAGRGFVEVSGKQRLIFPDISRVTAGKLLLDPSNISIGVGSQAGDSEITGDGALRDEEPGDTIFLSEGAIANFGGDVSLAAVNQISVDAAVRLNKSNGSLTLTASTFVINGTITISGADSSGVGHYLSFELEGAGSTTPFTFGSGGNIITDDLRIARNYAGSEQAAIPTNFAAPGRKVMITGLANNNGRLAFPDGFNLCGAGNTGCGDLTINTGRIFFTNTTNNTIRAKSITITMYAAKSLVSNFAPAEFHAHEGDISLTANNGASIHSGGNQNFSFSATNDISFSNVVVTIGSSGQMALTAGVGDSTGVITLAGSAFTALSRLDLSQDGALFTAAAPYASKGSLVFVEADYRGTGTQTKPSWASNLTLTPDAPAAPTLTPANLDITDGNLETALADKFVIAANGGLDLGNFDLIASGMPLVIPASITFIRTSGTISITGGLTATAGASLNSDTIVLGGTITAGGDFVLNEANGSGIVITVGSDLTINSPLILSEEVDSLGSVGFDLTLSSVSGGASSLPFTLLGDNITLNGAVSVVAGAHLRITAAAGGITFASTSTAITAASITLSQTDAYAVSLPANFSTTPILASPTSFTKPASWGVCGANCSIPLVAANLDITDGDLEKALIGKFIIPSSGLLDLGGFNLMASGDPLVIPASILFIQTSGTISITGGLTKGEGLFLISDTVELGGTITTGAGSFSLNELNGSRIAITVGSDLTINSPLILSEEVDSLGSAGFDLTLASVTISNDFALLGANITLNGAVNAGANALTLTATAGGITFASTSTAISANSITLSQTDAYAVSLPANFSNTPILTSPTSFTKPAAWGVCGSNCVNPLSPANLVIINGNLTTAAAGKFDISGSTLSLGTFDLTASVVSLEIPSNITSITTTGTISITGGLTASAALSLSADTALTIGGTWALGGNALALTAGTGAIAFNSGSAITASAITLTQAAEFPRTAPAVNFGSTTPAIVRTGAAQRRVPWASGGTTIAGSITVDAGSADISLTDVILGYFNISNSTLNLGSHTLSLTTSGRIFFPTGLRNIGVSNSTISFSAAGITSGSLVIITARRLALKGTFDFGTGSVIFTVGNQIDFSKGAVTIRSGNINITSPGFPSSFLAGSDPLTFTATRNLTLVRNIGTSATPINLSYGGELRGTPTLAASALSFTYTGSGSATLPSWVFGSRPMTLTVPSINIAGNTTWAAPSITFTRNTNITGAGALTLNVPTIDAGSNNLTINLPNLIFNGGTTITAANINLTASAGGIAFGSGSTVTATTAINLSQETEYAESAPATFNPTPTVTSSGNFNKPSWGNCGANCLVPANLDITDGNLTTATAGKFDISGTTLELGDFDLTASSDSLIIPSNITSITTTGTISITGGLTATAALSLSADTALTVGGTWALVGNDLALTTGTGAIAFDSNPTIMAGSTTLTQVDEFSRAAPANFGSTGSSVPFIVRTGGTQRAVSWASGGTTTAGNITVDAGSADIILTDEVAGYFSIIGGVLNLGSNGLSLTTTGNVVLPAGLTSITGSQLALSIAGTISGGSNDLTISASSFFLLSGAANFGTTSVTLSSGGLFQISGAVAITAQNLTFSYGGSLSGAPIVNASALNVIYTGASSVALGGWVFGSRPTTLTVPAISIAANTTWTADSITFTGNTNITGAGSLTLNVPTINAGSNDLTIDLPALTLGDGTTITAGNINLTASAGGIDFGTGSTVTAVTAINLSQTTAYAVDVPATFSPEPRLTSPASFVRPTAWGVCGANCSDLAPANLDITNGNLEAALPGKFDVSNGILSLGSYDLTASGVALVIPSNILHITTSGTISITGGLTATAALNVSGGGGLTVGGTWALGGNALVLTTGTGVIAFNSGSAITASSSITLTQVDEFSRTPPTATFSVTPAIVSTSGTQQAVPWATGGAVTAGNLTVDTGTADIILADEIVGFFNIVGGVLDLGSNSLSLTTSGDVVLPADLTRITGTGSITIMAGNTASGTQDTLTLATTGTLTVGGDFNYSSLTLDAGTLDLSATHTLGTAALAHVRLAYGTLQGTPSLHSNVGTLTVTTIGTDSRTFDGTATPWLIVDGLNTTINTGGDLELTGTFNAGGSNLTFNAGGTGRLIFTGNPSFSAGAIALSQGNAEQYSKAAPANFTGATVTIDATHNRVSWAGGGGALLGGDVVLTGGSSAFNLLDEIAAYHDITSNTLDLGGSNLTVSGNILAPSTVTSITTTGTISITGGLTATAALNVNGGGGLTIGGMWNLGSNDLALTTGAGAIAFDSGSVITAGAINLTQVGEFFRTAPADFGSTSPFIARTGGAFLRAVPWASGGTITAGSLTVDAGADDIILADEIIGYFIIDSTSGVLDLGSNNLSLTTTGNVVLPAGLTSITGGSLALSVAGTISGGSNDLTISALSLTLSVAANFGTTSVTLRAENLFQISGPLMITAQNLTLSYDGPFIAPQAPAVNVSALNVIYTGLGSVGLPSWFFGSYPTTLTVPEITINGTIVWAGDSITFAGNTNITGAGTVVLSVPMIDAGSNDLTITLPTLTLGDGTTMTAANINLTASVGGIDFGTGSTVTATTAINLSQTAPYAETKPATFSPVPILTSAANFNKPAAWGECGANCFERKNIDAVTTLDTNLADLVAGVFAISGGTLNVGSFDLSIRITGGTLTLPNDLIAITGTGSITIIADDITSGTQSSLRLETSGTLTVGGNFNYGTLTLDAGTLDLSAAHTLGAASSLGDSIVRLAYGTLQGAPSLHNDVSTLAVTTIGTDSRTFDASVTPWLTRDGQSTTINTEGDLELVGTFSADSADLTFNAGGTGQIIFTGNPSITADNIVLSQGSAEQYSKAAPADFGGNAVTIDSNHNRVSWASGGGALLSTGSGLIITGRTDDIIFADETAAYYTIEGAGALKGTVGFGRNVGNLTLETTGDIILPNNLNDITHSSASITLKAGGEVRFAGTPHHANLFLVVANLTLEGSFNLPVLVTMFGSGRLHFGTERATTISTTSIFINLSAGNAVPSGQDLTIRTTGNLRLRGGRNFNLLNTGAGALTLEAGVGGGTGTIEYSLGQGNYGLTAASIALKQNGALFSAVAPTGITFSTRPTIEYTGTLAQRSVPWADGGVAIGADINLSESGSDFNLEEIITGFFVIDGNGLLDLGDFDLTLGPDLDNIDGDIAGNLIVPSHLVEIRTSGTISLEVAGFQGVGSQFALNAGTLTLFENLDFGATALSLRGTTALQLSGGSFDTTITANSIELHAGSFTGTVPLILTATTGSITLSGELDLGTGFDDTFTNEIPNTLTLNFGANLEEGSSPLTLTAGLITATRSGTGSATLADWLFEGQDVTLNVPEINIPTATTWAPTSITFAGNAAITGAVALTLNIAAINAGTNDISINVESLTFAAAAATAIEAQNISLISTAGTSSTFNLTLTATNDITLAGSVDIGSGDLALTATGGAIVFTASPAITAATITLAQNATYNPASPANFSVVPVASRSGLSAGEAYVVYDWATCPIGDTNCRSPQNIVLVDQTTDIVLTDVIDGKFSLTVGDTTLDLQGSNLDLRTTANIILPVGLTSIITSGNITLVAASILTDGASQISNVLTIDANGLALGGTISTDTNDLTLKAAAGALSFIGDTMITGGDIQLISGNTSVPSTANPVVSVEASVSLSVTGFVHVGTGSIALTLTTTGSSAIAFTTADLTADTITLTQSAAYPTLSPATFSVLPALIRTDSANASFNTPSWGVCGTDAQCFTSESIDVTDVVDATLVDLIAGKFFITSGGVLDLGSSSLSIVISGELTLPANLAEIRTDSNNITLVANTFSSSSELFIQTMTSGDITLQGTYDVGTSYALTIFSAGALNFGTGAETSLTASFIALNSSAAATASGQKLTLSGPTALALNANINVAELVLSSGSIAGSAPTITTSDLTLDYTGTTAITFAGSHWVFAEGRNVTLRTTDSGATINLFAADSDDDTINLCVTDGTCGNLTIDAAGEIGLVASTEATVGLGTISANDITLNAGSIGSDITDTNRNLTIEASGNLTIDTATFALINPLGAALTFDVAGSTTFTQDITIDAETISGLGGDITAEALTLSSSGSTTGSITFDGGRPTDITATGAVSIDAVTISELGGTITAESLMLSSGGAATGSIAFSTARETSITTTGAITLEFETAGTASGQNLTLTASGGDITLGSLNIGSGILEVVTDQNIAFTATPDITAAEIYLTWAGDADLGTTAPATFTDGTNTILPFVEAASQAAATWFQLAGFSFDAGSDDINFFEGVTLNRGSETIEALVDENGVLDFGDNIIRLTTLGNIIFPGRLIEIRARNLIITADTIGRGAQAAPFALALAITTTGDLELNGMLAMDTGVALNLSFGGSLEGAPTLTTTDLGITSTGSDAITLPSWVFGEATRQVRLNVAAITLAESETWVAERITLGENTTITSTGSGTFLLNVPTVEAGANTLTINVEQLNFLPGAASTITAGTVSLTAVTASGEPSSTPSLTITATTGNLTLAGRFTVGAGAMILTATQGVIVFTANPTLTAASFSLTQGGAAFAAAKPATFRNNAGDVRPTIRYTAGVQLPVDWDVESPTESIEETDGGGYNIFVLLSTDGALESFETTPGVLDFGENDFILDTDNNITIPGRITRILARNIFIRADIFGRGPVDTPAALNRDIEFVATDSIIFRADIQSDNKITFTGAGITFNDKKTTRIGASEIVITATGAALANNQNVFLEAAGNITLAGNVDVGLGSLIINAGGSIVTTAATSLRANKISYNPGVVVRNANALTLTAYDDIYLPGINLNNGDGALSLTAGGSIVTGSARSILGTTIGFTQGQARYETGRLLLRAFTGALTIDGHIAHDMITLRVSDPALLDLTDAILEGEVIESTQ